MNIDDKKIEIYYKTSNKKQLPVIILNTFNNEGLSVWNECIKLNCNDFILVAISNIEWNDDMTPWECPPLYKGDTKCLGKADKYLEVLEKKIIPKIEAYITEVLKKSFVLWNSRLFSCRTICIVFWI